MLTLVLATLTPVRRTPYHPTLDSDHFRGSRIVLVRRCFYNCQALLFIWERRGGGRTLEAPLPLRPVEGILIARWLLFVAAALGGLLFTREKWVLALGTEVLFFLFCVVVLSSAGVGARMWGRH